MKIVKRALIMSEELQSNPNHPPLDRMSDKLTQFESNLKHSLQRRNRDGLKQLLLQELENASNATLEKTLDFVRFLNYDEQELTQDLADARAALEEAKREGTVSLTDLKRELGL